MFKDTIDHDQNTCKVLKKVQEALHTQDTYYLHGEERQKNAMQRTFNFFCVSRVTDITFNKHSSGSVVECLTRD